MMNGLRSLFKKDVRLMIWGKFFLMSLGFLIVYTLYVNLGYVRFMDGAERYQVYLYDPAGTQKTVSPQVQKVSTREKLDQLLLDDANSVGIDASAGEPEFILYRRTGDADRHRADYAFSLLQISADNRSEIVGSNTLEQKARKEITCELLFFEIAAVGFLGIASVLFKEKGMGVIRVHAVLPIHKELFLVSKLAVFLLSDLIFAFFLTLLNVGAADTAAVLPALLLQTAILSAVMALTGLVCAMVLKDFRQFTLLYLLITVFAATPVFLSANTAVKLTWIRFHPFYHIYMGLKNAYFGTPAESPLYYVGCLAAIAVLFMGARHVFHKEMGK